MLKNLQKSKHLKILCFKYTSLCYLNTLSVQETKSQDLIAKRFGRKTPIQKSTTVNFNFVNNLFCGLFDKEIFQFPSVVQKKELDSLLRHSVEIENYLRTSVDLNSGINKNVIEGLQKVEAFGLTIPTKYNGSGYSLTESIFLLECMARNFKVGQFIRSNENLGIYALIKYGSEEQKQKYLPKLATGEISATVAFLENGPLMDAANFNGMAVFDSANQEFVINAKKNWVPYADLADIILVFTKAMSFNSVESIKGSYKIFIVEKNTPGMSIQQLQSERAKDFGLFEVNLQNVRVPQANVIDEGEENGYFMLLNILTHGELCIAALCSSMLKKLIFAISNVSSEKSLLNNKIENYDFVQSNVAYITAYAYALESSLYFAAGRIDLSEGGDFFNDAVINKIFAIKALKLGIEKFVQITGTESIKNSYLLEEAWKVLQYCTIFDENSILLKLFLGTEGIISKGKRSNELIKVRKPDEYPLESFKFFLKHNFHKKNKLTFKMELHESLSGAADSLEICFKCFEKNITELLVANGNFLLNEEYIITILTDMAAYLYVLTASLTRASNVYCNIEEDSENDINIAIFLSNIIETEFNHLQEILSKSKATVNFHKEIGQITFTQKNYAAAHPLIRTY